jgi:phosphoribosylformylglycinamidine cyclo-ligase
MTDKYAEVGVDVSKADRSIEEITRIITTTWSNNGLGAVKLPIGYFANVIDLGNGTGIAFTTDGVGSKTIMAEMLGKWDTIGIDCVAMNVNDLICTGATPLSMVDYIAVSQIDDEIIRDIAKGLADGAHQAGISISGGEISQLPDLMNGLDLSGSAVGLVEIDKIITGKDVSPGDSIIGLSSTGVHSNGLSLARRIWLERKQKLSRFSDVLEPIGDMLLSPTAIYVQEVMDLLGQLPIKGLVNITGDGLLNLNRIHNHEVSFYLDSLPVAPYIFQLLQQWGSLDDATMYQTFNMGIGFCVIVEKLHEKSVIDIVKYHGRDAWIIGTVIDDANNIVHIPAKHLVGYGKHFSRNDLI